MLLSSNLLARGLSRGSQESLALRIARVPMGQSAVEMEVLEHDFCVESVANSSTAAEVVRIVWRLDNRTACTDDRLGCSPRDRDAIMVRRAAS